MNKKRLLLIVGGLAVATLLISTASRGGGLSRLMKVLPHPYSGEMGIGGAAPSRMEPDLMVAEDRMIGSPGIYPPYYPYPEDNALDVSERLLTRSAYYSVIHSNPADYLRSMREYIESIDGQVLSYSMGKHDRYSTGYLYAKIPADRFDDATRLTVEGVREVVEENVSADDITGQVVGQQERLDSLQAELVERQAELAALTVGTPEYTRVQGLIDNLERQIERLEDAQESTEERVQYSTLNISVADSSRYFKPGVPGDFMSELLAAWDSLKVTLLRLGAFAIWAVVYAVIWLPVVLIAAWVWKKVKRPVV